MTKDSQNNGQTNKSPTSLDVARVKDRIIHISPTNRKRQEDITIENFTNEDRDYVYIQLREFERDLTVYDEDETMLNIYPSRYVSEAITELEEESTEASNELANLTSRDGPFAFIQLPTGRPLTSDTLRTLRLEFEQSDQVKQRGFYEALCERDYRHFFFDIPYFAANTRREIDETHDEFLIVIGTPGYEIRGTSDHDSQNLKKRTGHELYENGIDDNTRTLSIRLPAPETEPYNYQLEYELIPSNKSLLRALAIYWAGTSLVGIASLLIAVFGEPIDVLAFLQPFAGIQTALSAGVVSGTLGIIFALDADWTDRFRILSLVPVIIHTLAWVVWTNAGVTFP